MIENTPFGARSYPYAIGRVRVRESSLLDRSQWNRLLEADEENALQALREFGYGASEGHSAPGASVDALIAAELQETAAFIAEVTPDRELTDLFLLPTDGHNLKALLKARLLQRDDAADDILQGGGSLPVEVLRACVAYEDLSPLPEAMAAELAGVFAEENPRLLSAQVDRAVFAQIAAALQKPPSGILSRYFAVWTRYLALLSAQRGQNLGWDERRLQGMEQPLITAKEDPIEELPAVIPGETLRETERNMNRALLSLLRDAKGDSFGIAPIVCYLLDKRNEARNLRILFAAKRASLPVTAAELDL